MAGQQCLSRLLQALDYPRTKEFTVEDPTKLSRLVTWVEDRKIRLYEISEREPLRQPGPTWTQAFNQYLAACECPYPWADAKVEGGGVGAGQLRCLRWLLTKALACEYEDAGEMYNASVAGGSKAPPPSSATATSCTPGGGGGGTGGGSEGGAPPADLSGRIKALAGSLGLGTGAGTDANQQLEAILALVQTRLSPSVIAAIKSPPAERPKIDDFPLSFTTGDPSVDRVARALAMLYVSDLRELQNDVNDMVVSVQSFTANPKTNTALGRISSVPNNTQEVAARHPILSKNWGRVRHNYFPEDGDGYALKFKDGNIVPGCGYGAKPRLEDAKIVSDSKVVFSLGDEGCGECGSNEVYVLTLLKGGNKPQLNIKYYAECYCDGQFTKCDESSYYAFLEEDEKKEEEEEEEEEQDEQEKDKKEDKEKGDGDAVEEEVANKKRKIEPN